MGVQFKLIMKTIGASLFVLFALIEFSWEARPPSQSLYGPPSSPLRPPPSSYGPPSSPPSHHHQPSCKQIPKEVCKQVPKQTYEFLTRFVPQLRKEPVPSDRDLSRSTPTRRFVPSGTGRSVILPMTSTSNVLKSRTRNATVLPSSSVSIFRRTKKKPSTMSNVPPSTTLSAASGSRTSVSL